MNTDIDGNFPSEFMIILKKCLFRTFEVVMVKRNYRPCQVPLN